MCKVDKQELRRLAESAIAGDWFDGGDLRYSDDKTGEVHGLNVEDERFIAAANPCAILSLLDELDATHNAMLAITARRFSEAWSRRTTDAQLEEYLSKGIAQLEAELEQYRKDAESYRRLRNSGNWPAVFANCNSPEPLRGAELDEAMAKEGGANG